ncbi:hypothetical protein LUX57_00960 [Actinomadura madurae]|nr:hypothetical protein [Actinomadura madurae]MCP9963926.1 hypothetical protein [Actinomadura madurae]
MIIITVLALLAEYLLTLLEGPAAALASRRVRARRPDLTAPTPGSARPGEPPCPAPQSG